MLKTHIVPTEKKVFPTKKRVKNTRSDQLQCLKMNDGKKNKGTKNG